jgi:hypothetical protein
VNQLNAEIAAARNNGDDEALTELTARYQNLMERKKQFVPVQSPYFRDTRDTKKLG